MFLDVAEVFVGYTVSVCVLFIVDGCQLNTGPGPGPGTRRGQSIFFLKKKKKKDCCFWVTVGVRVRLGLELMSTLTLTLTVTLKQHLLKKDRPRPRVLLTRTLDSFSSLQGSFHMYPDIFENGDLSLRLQNNTRPHVAYSIRFRPTIEKRQNNRNTIASLTEHA